MIGKLMALQDSFVCEKREKKVKTPPFSRFFQTLVCLMAHPTQILIFYTKNFFFFSLNNNNKKSFYTNFLNDFYLSRYFFFFVCCWVGGKASSEKPLERHVKAYPPTLLTLTIKENLHIKQRGSADDMI